jgi:hypothetical protein
VFLFVCFAMMMMIGPYLFGTKKVRIMYLTAFHFFSIVIIIIISEDVGDDLQRSARKN